MLACVVAVHALRASIAALIAACTTLSAPGRLAAQGNRVRPELRTEVVSGRVVAAHAGGALMLGTGTYIHGALVVGGGPAWKGRDSRSGFKADLVARFFLDPFRESRWGLYGTAGLGALYDGFEGWRPILATGVGLEFPSVARATWAAEVGLGGGFRVALALRRALPRRR